MFGRFKSFIRLFCFFSLLFTTTPLFSKALSGESDPWSFISKSTCGIDRFLAQHPTADGRGVLILIFDTGVDMGIAGLKTTSTGSRKVVDIRDFSGGGDIIITPPIPYTENEASFITDSLTTLSLKGIDSFNILPTDSSLRIGIFSELQFQNSDYRDFDGNKSYDSEFGFVTFKTDSGYVAVIDIDRDGDLSNETPIMSYAKHFQTFVFSKAPEKHTNLTTCAINIYPGQNKVVFHFDDSSHGTHVAGIAAGHNIYGSDSIETFDGIAPGAEVISCKISKGNIGDLSTPGSIARAFEYAAQLSKSQPKPVVVNMSFGIPSVIEGHAQIETYIDSLINNHPKLYVCLSNGNEGPGLSSTGLPAASAYAISVGALLNKDIAQNSFGSQQQDHQIWNFSSRGGEVPKPDVVAPGSAHSTVPGFAYRTISSGTSMASPYVAGSVALLLSALQQEDSVGFAAGHYTQQIIKTALKTTANPLPGYTAPDYGSGIVNLPQAYQTLKAYKKSGFTSSAVHYRIKTQAPNLGSRIFTPNAYFRSLTLEDIDFKKVFYVSVDFPDSLSRKEKNQFFRIYQLSSNQTWLKPLQKSMFLRGQKQKPISVVYNKKLLKKPGLYHGIITAKASHKSKAKRLQKRRSKDVEFELHNVIIVPYRFSGESDNKIRINRQTLRSGNLKRYYFAVPHTASSFRIKLISNTGKALPVTGTLVDPTGKVVGYLPPMNADEYFTDEYLSGDKLNPGIYELVVEADRFSKPERHTFNIEARLESIRIQHLYTNQNQIHFSITNSGQGKIYGSVTGSMEGFTKTWGDSIYSPAVYRRPIQLYPEAETISLKFSVSPEDYNKNTDAAIMVLDSSGRKITSLSLDSPEEELFFYHPDKSNKSLSVFLEIHYGFTFANRGDGIYFNLEETHSTKSNILECHPGAFNLYPYLPQHVYVEFPSTLKPPSGFKLKGSIRFEETAKGIFQSKKTFVLDQIISN
jgi:subtilisin family serine protease